jgi:N-sulfoglucosamine sulfohydrolase
MQQHLSKRNNLLSSATHRLATGILLWWGFLQANAQDQKITPTINTSAGDGAKPNILFISADDLGDGFLNCTGNKTPGLSPNIDRFASQSVRFANAFVTASISQPSRSVWITGCYPHRNGAVGFNPVVQPRAMLGEQLRKAGYHTGLFGKGEHYAPIGPEHWDDCVAHLKGAGRDADVFVEEIRRSILNAQRQNKPFFIHANCADPHRPFSNSPRDYQGMKAPSKLFTPEEVDIPGFLFDTPAARQELARYCNSVRRMDDVAGAILTLIDELKLAGETIVIFASDNGAPLPFGKGSCYLQSHRTPLMIRMEGLSPGVENTHFVNGIDMMPTILDMAGAPQPEYMDGYSFLPVLKGERQSERDHVHVVYHRDQNSATEQRAIHYKKYGYIYNEWRAWEYQRDIKFVADNNMVIIGQSNDPAIVERRAFYLKRAPEELYDYDTDPFSQHNLVGNLAYDAVLQEMRDHLHQWMIQTGDYVEQGYMMYIRKTRDKEKK